MVAADPFHWKSEPGFTLTERAVLVLIFLCLCLLIQGSELSNAGYRQASLATGKERLLTRAMGDQRYNEIAMGGKRHGPPHKRRFTNGCGMTFIWIPPGRFFMGSPQNEPGRGRDELRRKVTLTKGFYMQTTEVTQRQWRKVTGKEPSFHRDCGEDCPVEMVSWHDVQDFILLMNRQETGRHYRLPTEAEWEYACRSGTETPFSFGKCLTTAQANYEGDYPLPGCAKGGYLGRPVPVAGLLPNAWGLYDMHGNVWEWCQDRYAPYDPTLVIDPKGPGSGNRRVIRGGCWFDFANACRSARRAAYPPGTAFNSLGLRLVTSGE
jgi:formylglycine-generating enzyme required for sulfatase activity